METPQRARGRWMTRRWPAKLACWSPIGDAKHDIDRFIWAFIQTVADQLSSLSSGSIPPDLAAIAARFSSCARGSIQDSFSSTPTFLRPSAEFTRLLSWSTCRPSSDWTVLVPRRTNRTSRHERARTATAPKASRLDSRRDSLSDLDRPWRAKCAFRLLQCYARQHTLHHTTPPARKDEVRTWPSAQPPVTPRHFDECFSYDSWAAEDMRVSAVLSCFCGHGLTRQSSHPDAWPISYERLMRLRDTGASVHTEDPRQLL